MVLLLSAVLAAEGPIEVEGMPGHYVVQDRGGRIDSLEFALTVQDAHVVDTYRRSNALRKTISITGWVGGGVVVYGGFVAFVIGGFGSSPELMVIGLGGVGTGLTTIGLVSVNHVVWGRKLDDYDTWWTYEQALALAEQHNATLEPEPSRTPGLRIVDQGLSWSVLEDTERLNTGEFASRVGDVSTYRRWNAARLLCNSMGWTAFGLGLILTSNSLPMAMDDLASGRSPDPVEGSLAMMGLAGLVGGPVLVYGSKVFYNDPARYYTRQDAERWIAGPGVSHQPRVFVEVHPTGVAVLW